MAKSLIGALGLAVAATAFSGAVSAQEVYGKAGILGVGAGYAYGVNERFTLRGDITTIGSYSRNGTSDNLDYRGKLRSNVATVYGDWFPFNNGFRLSLGLGFRDTRLTAHGKANSANQLTIGDTTVTVGPDDTVDAKVKWPNVAPYLGIGWGHNVNQRKGGWGFVADAGIYIGKPKSSIDVSDTLRAKLDVAAAANGSTAQQEIDKQLGEIDDKAKKLRVFPSVYIGVSYVF